MRVWAKKPQVEAGSSSVARMALAGASREEWLREALKLLRREQDAKRIGVWLEPDSFSRAINELSGAFHGLVWDRALNEDCPPGWKLLSLEPPLPERLLNSGKPFEQNLEDSLSNPVIGQLLGLRRAIWFPVVYQHHVKGLILLGSKDKTLALSREHAESVASELALAVEFQDQLRLNRVRNADLAFTRRLLESSPGDLSFETWLSNLVADCVQQPQNGDAPAAAFVMIGLLRDPLENSSSLVAVDFRWCSGDPSWTRAAESEPLAKVWRRALEVRHVIGSEPPVTWPQTSVARIVAFPLEAEGTLLGALVAGLPAGAASLATLDRLELRALLAAAALHRRKQKQQAALGTFSQQVLLDLIGDPVVLLDDAGKITASSPGARELLRQVGPASTLPSGHISELFCDRDREPVRDWLQRELDPSGALRSGRKEAPLVELQNGIQVRLQIFPRQSGQPAAALLKLEEAAETPRQTDRAGAELRTVVEGLEEGIVVYDARENVRAINSRFEQIVGLAPEDSGKIKTFEDLIARLESLAVEPRRFAERWRKVARGAQGDVREELQMVRPAPRLLERTARPVLDSAGRQLGRVEIYRDLSAQRVLHSKLLQTEKLAALGQMVSGIAHELSNPLTSILGYAQRLLARQNVLERSEEVRQIYQEAERAGAILRRLLLNARETVPERRLVSLNQVVMRAMDLQRFSLAAGKIRVELDLDPAIPFIHGDAGQLQQVLINLLGNAHQALEEQGRGGIIRLRTRKVGDRRVLLEVEDNGPGIPQAIQARIFDPFFTTKPAGIGTGLGLAIVMSVVREHGGEVRLQTPPQGGALFQIELPAASERQQDEALSRHLRDTNAKFLEPLELASPLRLASSFESWKGARVLVVEDEPTVARLIADVLEDEGMTVDVLLDGREALDRVARESYDLVICDMKMPGLDGQHFYRSLERNGNALRERFLFVTGDVLAAQTREFLKRNRLPHVAKPFRVEELTEKVHAVLRKHAGGEAPVTEMSKKNVARNG